VEGWTLVVEQVQGRRIRRVRVRSTPAVIPAQEEEKNNESAS
jgi:CBS domain containing-hemolysin-like protein